VTINFSDYQPHIGQVAYFAPRQNNASLSLNVM